MKKLISLFIIILSLLLSLSACKSNGDENSDRITLYELENSWGSMGVHYQYNKSVNNEADKIKIVTFESVQAMKDKMSSELMAGRGPDIILDNTLMMAGISIHKLIDTDSFLNLSKLDLDLSNCYKGVFSTSVSDGKLLFVPSFYSPKFWICCEKDIKDVVDGDVLSYDELITLSKSTNKKLFADSIFNDSFILNFVADSVDFENKRFDFDKDTFKSTIEKLKDLCDLENQKKGDDFVFDIEAKRSPYNIYTAFAKMESKGKTPAIVGSPSLNDTLGAYFVDEIFINKNLDKSKFERIKKFLVYAMSERYQSEEAGADIEQYNPLFSYLTGNLFPTNNQSFEKLMNNADSFSYNTSGIYEPDGSDSPRTDEPQARISDKSIKLLHDKLESIQYYEMNDYYIGYNQVVQDMIEDYYNNKISVDNLISQLKSKTQIYLEE